MKTPRNGEPWEDAGEEWQRDNLNPDYDQRGEDWKGEPPEEPITDYTNTGAAFWAGTGSGAVSDDADLHGWWLRRLYHAVTTHAPAAGAEVRKRMMVWLVEVSDAFYKSFRTPETYAPGAPGHWVMDTDELARDLPKALAWATGVPVLPRAYRDPGPGWPTPTPPKEYASLEVWLEAERSGKVDNVPLHEPSAHTAANAAWHLDIIPKSEVQSLCDRTLALSSKRRQNPWPRVCCKCGSEFRPKANDSRQLKAKRVRCETCRKAARR